MRRYRKRPLYSACNEDSRSELRALQIGRGDTVVAICAGGGRALSLLGTGPRGLVAVDARPDQLFQLELKAAAIDAMDYDGFARFIGLRPGADRRDLYSLLRASLSPSARRYWDARTGLVSEGALFAGRCERALSSYVRRLRQLGRLRWVARYFRAGDLDEQREMIEEDGGRLLRSELYWRVYCHPLLVYAATQDPGFLSSTESVGRCLHSRFVRYLERNLIRDSFMLHLIYFGYYGPESVAPPYLQRPGFEAAKKHLDRLSLRCESIQDFAARLRIDGPVKWSLSDVSAWMEEARFHELVDLITRRGAPGSRFCARQFAARRSLPEGLAGRIRRLGDLCERLEAEDRSIFWSFDVAEYEGRLDLS